MTKGNGRLPAKQTFPPKSRISAETVKYLYSMAEIYTFPDGPAVARAFADHVAKRVEAKAGDAFFWALSGGSTPKLLFELLARDYREKIDWSKIHFFWGDERLVPHDDPESNYGEVKRLLFDHVPVVREQIHAVRTELEPEAAARDYAETMVRLLPMNSDGLPILDLNMLGMGGDGHTASIFPANMGELLKSDKICAVATHPESGQLRVTMTGPTLSAADEVAFLITGQGKAARLVQILNGEAGAENFPVSHVRPSEGKLTWYVDEAAAASVKAG